MEQYLGSGGKGPPQFGGVVLFTTEDGEVVHAAVVLGVANDGSVYILAKNNAFKPYTITMAEWPGAKPTYYKPPVVRPEAKDP